MRKGYPWIDRMRIIAAILVVSIHISPFVQFNPTIDFILTRIIGRLAVPFFFITTSYFLFMNGYPSYQKIKKTIINLCQWYGLSIIIYLPLMFYNHYFQSKELFFKIIRDLFIDGTFYHLWYFPAVIIGIMIVLLLRKYFSIKLSFIIVGILYFIGLCGDSYYYLAIQIPMCKDFINGLFQYMDYTRNGFFFAPLFLMIGVYIAENKNRLTLKGNSLLFVVFLIMMGLEAQNIRFMDSARHDSMYILLPVVSYFLFQLLIYFKGKRYENMKNISLYIYIIHPMMIVFVRMIGKLIKINMFIENNFIQFLLVMILSLGLSAFVNGFIQESESYEKCNI